MAAETSGGQGNLKHASPIPPELRRFYRRKNFPVARLGESALPWYAEMTKATISSKGQIAIPKAVRQRLNLKAGTEISIDTIQERPRGGRLMSSQSCEQMYRVGSR